MHIGKRSLPRKWIVFGAGCVLALVACGFTVVRWPFRRAEIVRSLSEAFSGAVEVKDFKRVFFPYPGCVLHGVTVRRAGAPPSAPLLAIDSLLIRGDYPSLLRFSKHLQAIRVSGMRVNIRRNDGSNSAANGGASRVPAITVGDFEADHVLLAFEPEDAAKDPYVISVDRVRLRNVAANRPFSFETTVHVAEPEGEVQARGRFGPWNAKEPYKTPVSGLYSFDRANLAFAKGIAGRLASRGEFRGPLGRIEVAGSADVPRFEVTHAHHPEPLHAKFRAIVNGRTGDVALDSIDARLAGTRIHAAGDIRQRAPDQGKVAALDIAVADGRIQDLLKLFSQAERPGMTGDVKLRAHVLLPAGASSFLSRLRINGDVEIREARFTNPKTEDGMDRLSERATGGKGKEPVPADVPANLGAHVTLEHAIAKISGLWFSIPGAQAQLAGTYNLKDTFADLHGTAHTNVKLSKTQSGLKALFLKVLDPKFRDRNGQGSDVPVKIRGPYGHTALGLDLSK